MEEERKLIKLPNIMRRTEYGIDVKAKEVLMSSLVLSNKFGGESKTTISFLRDVYNLPRRLVDEAVEIIHTIHEKGLVNIRNIDKVKDINSLIIAEEVELEDGEYTTIDFTLIEKILEEEGRIDSKANAVYVLVLLQSRGGYRDLKNPTRTQKGYSFPSYQSIADDIGISLSGVKTAIQRLEEIGILEVVNNGKYTTRGEEGQSQIRNYSNTYIIKQINYTYRDVEQIKEEAKRDLGKVDEEAKDKIGKATMISSVTEDGYVSQEVMEANEGKIEYFKDIEMEKGRETRERNRQKQLSKQREKRQRAIEDGELIKF